MMFYPRSLVLGLLVSSATLNAQTPTLFRFPLESNPGITSWFDLDDSSSNRKRFDCDIKFSREGHHGLDIDAKRDTGIRAAASGVVDLTITGCPDDTIHQTCGNLNPDTTTGGFGNHVRLRHADGKVTIYAHMLKLAAEVTVNSTVQCAAEIGKSGTSGGSTGYHLHFELWKDRNRSQRLDFFSGNCNSTSYWVSQYGISPDAADWRTPSTQCQATGSSIPAITSFDITPRSSTVGTQLVATVKGTAGSKPLSTVVLLRTTDLTGNTGWTTATTQPVSGNSVNVILNDTPPVGTFLYGAHLVDNTGQYGVEPSKVPVTVAQTSQSSPEVTSLTAVPQQASWVYYNYKSNSADQWYISNSSGVTYLLSGSTGYGGELVWGQIAAGNPVATVNYLAKTVSVASSALTQTSPTSYPGLTLAGGRDINVLSSRGYAAAQLVAGQNLSHAWYFFKVQSTGIWYIVNYSGADTVVYRLQLKPDNSDYDWVRISNSSWKRTLSPTASSMTITLSER